MNNLSIYQVTLLKEGKYYADNLKWPKRHLQATATGQSRRKSAWNRFSRHMTCFVFIRRETEHCS